jgi:flagellar basal-body rod protein FlgB
MGLFDVTNSALEVALRGAEAQQTAISNNLANANTPGFRPTSVSFQGQLADALQTSPNDPNAIDQVQPTESVDPGIMRTDGSGIDVDRQSVELAKTQMIFETAMAMDTKRLHTLSQLITSAR